MKKYESRRIEIPVRDSCEEPLFTKDRNTSYQITDIGVDQIVLGIFNQIQSRWNSVPGQWRRTSNPNRFAGPKDEGIWIGKRIIDDRKTGFRDQYFMVSICPDTLLGLTRKPVSGSQLLESVIIAAEWLSEHVFAIEPSELLTSMLLKLEIAADFVGLQNSDLANYPYRFQKGEQYRIYDDDVRERYQRIVSKSSQTVGYEKKLAVSTELDWRFIVDRVFRLEFRFYRHSVNTILGVNNALDRNISNLISSKTLSSNLEKALRWRLLIHEGVDLVSKGLVVRELKADSPRHLQRLLREIEYSRDEVLADPVFRNDYHHLRKYLKKEYSQVFSSPSDNLVRIVGFFETLANAYQAFQVNNHKAVPELSKICNGEKLLYG